MPVEAQACGRPVVALNRGGVLETVRDGETGLFFDQQTPESLNEALKHFDDVRWDSASIREHALQFRIERFMGEMRETIEECLDGASDRQGVKPA